MSKKNKCKYVSKKKARAITCSMCMFFCINEGGAYGRCCATNPSNWRRPSDPACKLDFSFKK